MACLGRSTDSLKRHLLAFMLCASTVFWSEYAQALRIGNPQFDSGLTQALLVRIPIRGFAPGTRPQDYSISALPSSEYAKLGLAIPAFPLQQLSFRWLNETRNGAEILISSERRIAEPVINILLEVRGPDRRWVKQVNLLLDPPTQEPAPPAPIVATGRTASRRHAGARLNPSNGYGPVKAGEVLSVIAQKLRPDPKIPLVQMAQAIIDANPNAFPTGPQSLRAGAVLQVPQLRQIERAALNKQLMKPTAQAAAKKKAAGARTGVRAPFLPSYRYANGAMYPLSTLFLSYEAIKPIDLKSHLVSLEQSEPVRFRADWTLSQAANPSAPNRLLNPQISTALEDGAESLAQPDDAAAPLAELKQRRRAERSETQDSVNARQGEQSTPQSTSSHLPPNAQQKPNTATKPASAHITQANVPSSDNNTQPRWWLWLLGALIALALLRRMQSRSSTQEPVARRIPYNKQTSAAALHAPSKPAAAAMPAAPAPLPEQTSDAVESVATALGSESTADEETVSEQAEQKLRKDIRAMLNANLPSEAERKLKIADALAERGNHSRAKQMVTEIQDSLSEM